MDDADDVREVMRSDDVMRYWRSGERPPAAAQRLVLKSAENGGSGVAESPVQLPADPAEAAPAKTPPSVIP